MNGGDAIMYDDGGGEDVVEDEEHKRQMMVIVTVLGRSELMLSLLCLVYVGVINSLVYILC